MTERYLLVNLIIIIIIIIKIIIIIIIILIIILTIIFNVEYRKVLCQLLLPLKLFSPSPLSLYNALNNYITITIPDTMNIRLILRKY